MDHFFMLLRVVEGPGVWGTLLNPAIWKTEIEGSQFESSPGKKKKKVNCILK
jgi:hypothetical protein